MNPQYKLHISKLSTQDLIPHIQNSKHSPLISTIRQFNITGNDLLELREFDVRRKYGNQINLKQFQALLNNVQNSPQDLFAPPGGDAPILKKKLPRGTPNQETRKGTNYGQEDYVTSVKQQFERRCSVKLGSTATYKAPGVHATFPRPTPSQHKPSISTRNESHFTLKKNLQRGAEIAPGGKLLENQNHPTSYQQNEEVEEQSPFAKSIQHAKLTLQRTQTQSKAARYQKPFHQQRNITTPRSPPLDYEPQEYQNWSDASNNILAGSQTQELQEAKNANNNVSSLPQRQTVQQKVQRHQRNMSPPRPSPLDYDPQEYQNWSEVSNETLQPSQTHESPAFIQDLTEQHRKLTLQKNEKPSISRHQEVAHQRHISPARPPPLDYEPQEYQNWSEPSQQSQNQEQVSFQKVHHQRNNTPVRPPPADHDLQEYQNWSEESIDSSPGQNQDNPNTDFGNSSTLNAEKRRELQQKLNLVFELKKEQEQQQQQKPQASPENIYTEYDDDNDFEDEDMCKSNESVDSFTVPCPVPPFVPPALPRRPPEIFKSVSGVKKIKVKDVPGESIEKAPSRDPRSCGSGHHHGKLPMIPPSLPAADPRPQAIADDNEYVEPVNLSSPEFVLQKIKFFRNCKRDDGKRLLSSKPPGTFLIRPSDKYMAVLMFKGRTLYNVPIECDRSKRLFYLAPQPNSSNSAIKFAKIDELLNYYSECSPCGNGDCLLSIDINNLN